MAGNGRQGNNGRMPTDRLLAIALLMLGAGFVLLITLVAWLGSEVARLRDAYARSEADHRQRVVIERVASMARADELRKMRSRMSSLATGALRDDESGVRSIPG
jgi:hypothetical protein